MLGGQPDLEVVGEAGDGREGVARADGAAARRGADGHPDAAAQRPRRHPPAARARRTAAGDRADHLRRRRVRRRGARRRRRRVPAQGHPAAGGGRRDPQGRPGRPDALAHGDPLADPPGGRPPVARPRPRPASPTSPTASATWRSPSAAGSATPRSPPSSTSRCRRSRPTCRGSSTSSASPTACRSPCACTTPGWLALSVVEPGSRSASRVRPARYRGLDRSAVAGLPARPWRYLRVARTASADRGPVPTKFSAATANR